MKVGITSFGAYVPYRRVARSVLTGAWENKGGKGEISVAGTDEDAVTMAVEAGCACLRETERELVDRIYFASVTAPYAELNQSPIIAAACDLRDEVAAVDFAHTPRAGAGALLAAVDSVKAATASSVLVTAADTRCAYPKSPKEQLLGDAAAAVTVGRENVIAELIASSSVSNVIMDYWRNYGETYLRTAEGRFAGEEGYTDSMKKAVQAVLKQAELRPDQISQAVFTTPGLKDGEKLAAKLGFQPEQIADQLMMEVGDCGAAQPLLLLACALEKARAGDKILLAAYGSGADAMVFEVCPGIERFAARGQVQRILGTKRNLESYSKFLSYKNLLETNPGEPFRTFPSNAAYWRDRKSILNFHGSRCTGCGREIFPIHRVCYHCGSKDTYETVRMAERTARVFTYSIDNLAGRSDDPVVVQTVSEDDRGVRFYNLMTDFEADQIRVGMEVEFTFRKIYEGGNYNNYFWKCRPVRSGGTEA